MAHDQHDCDLYASRRQHKDHDYDYLEDSRGISRRQETMRKGAKNRSFSRKMHFSYDFLIRSTRFSYKILYISTRFSDFKSKSSLHCPCSITEDMPIDLRVIATSRSERTNVTENRQTVGKCKRKLPTCEGQQFLSSEDIACWKLPIQRLIQDITIRHGAVCISESIRFVLDAKHSQVLFAVVLQRTFAFRCNTYYCV